MATCCAQTFPDGGKEKDGVNGEQGFFVLILNKKLGRLLPQDASSATHDLGYAKFLSPGTLRPWGTCLLQQSLRHGTSCGTSRVKEVGEARAWGPWYLCLVKEIPDVILLSIHAPGHNSVGRNSGQVALLILAHWPPGVVWAEQLKLIPRSLVRQVLWLWGTVGGRGGEFRGDTLDITKSWPSPQRLPSYMISHCRS